MSKVVLGMTISLDGFVNDRSGSVAALYTDLADWRETDLGKESIQNTGAVVMGRNSYAMSEDPDWFAGNYEYQVPIFVLTHEPPGKHPKETDQLTFTFVTDGIESAVRQAKAAAGDKEVNIIGAASTAQQCLKAGLADELHVDIMPVFLGGGLRPFEDLGTSLPSLETHLKFRILK
jgi:dihydrofolate reductase